MRSLGKIYSIIISTKQCCRLIRPFESAIYIFALMQAYYITRQYNLYRCLLAGRWLAAGLALSSGLKMSQRRGF